MSNPTVWKFLNLFYFAEMGEYVFAEEYMPQPYARNATIKLIPIINEYASVCVGTNIDPANAAVKIATRPILDAIIQCLFFCLIARTTKITDPSIRKDPRII